MHKIRLNTIENFTRSLRLKISNARHFSSSTGDSGSLEQNTCKEVVGHEVAKYQRALVNGEEADLKFYRNDPVSPSSTKKPINWQSAKDAVKVIHSGQNVFVQGIAATPTPLLSALCSHAKERGLKDIVLHHLHLEGKAEWIQPEFEGIIRSNSMFTGSNLRQAVNNGRADAVSVFLSEIPWLFKRNVVNVGVALIHVSPPDRNGFCTLGTSVDCTRAAIINAKYRIALVNPHMPRTFGDGIIHSSHIDTMVFSDGELYERPKPGKKSETEELIGKKITEELVEDGATIQMGIGAIPDAALAALKGHRDLGIHTEMFSDGVLELVKCGAVTNSQKHVHPGKIVTSFVYGSRTLYHFLHDNPMIMMGDITWVNDTSVIRKNPKVTAINSAVEVDITGQVVSDSIGKRIISGFGGQVDFIRGASLSVDGRGKPIIALPSVTKNGQSKIVPYIQDGAGVVTTRAHVHYIVTEYGTAYLFGKSMRHRAYELINIAHPDHREWLEKMAFKRLKCMPAPD